MNQDQEHLRLLTIFHYVLAGLAALFACFPLIHVGLGLVLALAPEKMSNPGGVPPPPFIGWFFVILGSLFILAGWAYAVGVFVAGRCLGQRRRLLFCQVMAGIECLFMPFGTVLGVFTLIVLLRPSVQALFKAAPAPAVPPSLDA